MNFKEGDRVRMVHMPDDPDPIPPGSEGTVTSVGDALYDNTTQIGVKWDSGRTLFVITPPDRIRKIRE